MNSLSFSLSEKNLVLPSFLKYVFGEWMAFYFYFLFLSALNMLLLCLLACTDFHRKILICVPVHVMCPFYLSAFRIFFLILVFCSHFVF